jgi:anti-sigma regulatory factor (Ser/Thr protein kinase)
VSVLTAGHRRHVLTAPAVPATVRLARRTGQHAWASWGVNPSHPMLGPALLILTELVTNSVRHAAEASPTLDVIYAHAEGVLAFAVHDRHPFLPRFVRGATPHGRGLELTAELVAEHRGVHIARPDIDGAGKTVWITLPL